MKFKLPTIFNPSMRAIVVRTLFLILLWGLGKGMLNLGVGLPFWIFILVAVYTYFFPVFRQGLLLVPFLLFLSLSIYLPFGVWNALGLAVIFFLIMGIKDLLFVNRDTAYEILALLFFFVASLVAYSFSENWEGIRIVILPLLIGASYVLISSPIPWRDPPREEREMLPVLIFGYLVGQASWFILLLPMDWIYKAALLFAFTVLMTEFQGKFRNHGLTRKFILSATLPFAIIAGAILVLNNWGI